MSDSKVEKVEKEKDLFGKLRNTIIENREKYRRQLTDIKDKLEKNTQEIETLTVLRDKLQGAIEASDFYVKAVLPSNNLKTIE